MPPRTRVSMLELPELTELLGVSAVEIKRSLKGRVRAARYLGRALFEAEAVEARLRRAAAAKGMTLVTRTPFGDADLIRHGDEPKNEAGRMAPSPPKQSSAAPQDRCGGSAPKGATTSGALVSRVAPGARSLAAPSAPTVA
ncbi:MAG: hypothetical protein R3B07_28765 [Polyangiaceae bacterium]